MSEQPTYLKGIVARNAQTARDRLIDVRACTALLVVSTLTPDQRALLKIVQDHVDAALAALKELP